MIPLNRKISTSKEETTSVDWELFMPPKGTYDTPSFHYDHPCTLCESFEPIHPEPL